MSQILSLAAMQRMLTGDERAAGISTEARENQKMLYAITTRPACIASHMGWYNFSQVTQLSHHVSTTMLRQLAPAAWYLFL